MSSNFTAKSYYIFLSLLPLLFFYGISDMTLLPRQLFLTAFCALQLLFVLKVVKQDATPIKLDAANLAMVAYFMIAAIVSVSNAAIVSESIYFLSKLWILLSFTLLTVWLLEKNVVTVHQIVNAVIIFGCVAILTALADIADKTLGGENMLRNIHTISGGFSNKNLLSSILLLCLPFFMIGCSRTKWLKWMSYVAIFLTIAILFIVRTRAVLIAMVVFCGIIVFFFLSKFLKRRIWWATSVLSGLLIMLFLKFRIGETVGRLNSSADIKMHYLYRLFDTGTIKDRILFWENSLDMFREHPFGVGLGNWQVYFPKYGLQKFNSYEIANGNFTIGRPHNDFLWILCETGIFGFVAFAAIFVIILYQSLSLARSAMTKNDRQLFIYLFSALIGFIIVAFFDFPMERIEHQVILMLLFSIVIFQYGVANSNSFGFQIRPIWFRLFVAFGICFSFSIAVRRFDCERQIYKLQQARTAENVDGVLLFAQKAEKSVYKIDSKAMPLKWYMGTAYFSQGQFLESETCFKEAYRLTPYNIHVLNNLASCYEVNGKRDNAITFYLKALQISPDFDEARLNLAAVYFNNKEYDKAFLTIDKCAVDTRDPKYKIFLPPILKGKADMIIRSVNFSVAINGSPRGNLPDYSQLYFESKKNNITFEQQIIKHLQK